MFQSNEAGERGGAMYVTRESKVVWEGCHSQRNTASLGAAVYASNAVIELLGDSVLAYDEVRCERALVLFCFRVASCCVASRCVVRYVE